MRSTLRNAVTRYQRRIIRRFIADAFYSHEITSSDYLFLCGKVNTWRT